MLPRDERLLADLRALRRVMGAVLRAAEAERANAVPHATCEACGADKPALSLTRCDGCGELRCFGCAALCIGICRPRIGYDDG